MAEQRKSTPLPPAPITLSNLPERQPYEWIPDVFPTAQKTTTQLVPKIGEPDPLTGDRIEGYYEPGSNTAKLVQKPYGAPNQIAGHELGHAIYRKELTDEQRNQWAQLHTDAVHRMKITNDPWKYFEPGVKYPNDPAHSFAEAYGIYVNEPTYLQNRHPAVYNFIRDLAKFEYRRKETPPSQYKKKK